ncbi:MAG: SDR family oxidoreductase [Bacteroides sp.]|nr:SDR family oxidoreductase [Bacteroides sp.]
MPKTIFITGSSSGIGLATAKYFLEKGWNVACTMRDMSKADLLPTSSSLKIYNLDVTDSSLVKEVAQKAWNDFKEIDVVVNNAGYGAIGPLEGATERQIQKQLETNVMSICYVINAFTPLFSSVKKGTFINLSSIAGRLGFPLYSIYNASKFAIEGLTESLYYELSTKNIRVRLIEPGPIKTEFNGKSRVDLKPSPEQGYDEFIKKADAFINRFFVNAPEPEVVAKTIYKAATSKGKRLRYPAGIQSRLLMFFKKIVPNSWIRGMMKALIGI